MNLTIVIAWLETRRELVESDWPGRDLGRPGEFAEVEVAHAVTWLLSGGADDVAIATKKSRYLYGESARVYTFPTGEPSPLARARRARSIQK